ncbi:MAG: CRISPR/Cas system-associated exonuclease Cas4 (RecB family) [Myxococcota bacterium]|jgi:CRISPR/Cas system-associated exonuclease Cas4 (RecB family)
MANYKNELSWSASRAKEFERCRREYHYSRYASWGWWTEKPPAEKYEAMVHKNITSLPALAGTCMHDAVEHWFHLKRDGVDMKAEDLYAEAVDNFREGWRQSSTDAWRERPNKTVHIDEHHYRTEISKERTEKARELLERSAKYFVESEDCKPAREAHPDNWRSLESMDTYMFLGTKIYAVPDFAYVDGETVHIWDWKTGKPREEDIFQLHSYALYACEKWSADPESIVLHAAYLNEMRVDTIEVNLNKLSEVQDYMSQSVREMMDVHYDPDEDPVLIENWPKTSDESKCRWCRFRGICKPTL